MKEKEEKTCPKCGYVWIPRVSNPKRCPRCGKWLIPKPKEVQEHEL